MTAPTIADLYASDSGRATRRLARPTAVDTAAAATIVLAAVGGAMAGASPTGAALADIVWTGAAAAGLAALGRRASPEALLWTTLGAALAGSGSAFSVPSLAAGAVTLGLLAGRVPHAGGLVGTVAAGIAAQSLLRADDLVGARSSAAATLVMVAPVIVSGWCGLGSPTRRLATRVLIAVGALCLLATVAAAVAVWRVADRLEDAVSEARDGLDAGRDGDLDAAVDRLGAAGRELETVAGRLDSWMVRPALAVPGVGSNLRAARTASTEGSDLAGAATDLIESVDLDRLVVEGAVDLDRMAEMTSPVRSSRDTVASSLDRIEQARSPWLLPALQNRFDELVVETADALDNAERALQVLEVAPGMLGSDEPQRYLVLFGTPSETREGGGIVANVAEVVASEGRLTLGYRARNLELNLLSTATTLTDVESYPSRFVDGEPWLFSQNWTATPDFPTVARAVAELYPQMGGQPLDGVVYIDPFGLESLLAITGPVSVDGLQQALAAHTAAEFLLIGQYTQFPDLGDRVDFLDGAAQAVFDALVGLADLPSPSSLAEILGPAVDGRHLMVATLDPASAEMLASNELDGAFPREPGVDQVAVVQANLGADKLDAYLQRTITYDVTTDRSAGEFEAVLRVVLESTVPSGLPAHVVGVPEPGSSPEANDVLLSVYTHSEIVSTTVDRAPFAVEQRAEFGFNRYVIPVTVVPGDPTEVEWRFRGSLTEAAYELDWVGQAMVNDDIVTVTVDGRRWD